MLLIILTWRAMVNDNVYSVSAFIFELMSVGINVLTLTAEGTVGLHRSCFNFTGWKLRSIDDKTIAVTA